MPASNPYRRADLSPGTLDAALDALPTAQLVEHLRHLDHEQHRRPRGYDRWWLTKLLAAGQRALVRRGLAPTAWRQDVGDDR